MALFEQTPSRSGSRFGKLSSNMFFTRNTAKPKRVKHIEGLNGALICNVDDAPSVVQSRSNSSIDFTRMNLPSFQPTRRVERLIPPMGFWNTYGVVQDTDRWRNELTSLAAASGLGGEKDESKVNQRTATADQQNASRSGAHYSTRTGRFNEGAGKSRGRTGSKHATALADALYNVPENERELWMLQVLCQLLGTSNLQEVQSWLVSASHAEKEQARTMINSALRGLKESDRTAVEQSVDLNSLSNFVEKQKTEEKQATQKFLKETLHRSHSVGEAQQQTDQNSWTNLIPENSLTTPQRRSFSSFDTTNKKTEPTELDENHQPEKPHVDTLPLNDDDDEEKTTILPPIKPREEENVPSRRQIRQLQNKLSRQEEEAKKQLGELQAKQSRLENALKLLTKQTSIHEKRRSKNANENQPMRSFSGVWKPDTSTLHRLQGN